MTTAVTAPANTDEATDAVSVIRAHREQLTHLLRGLAARLDDLERRLADLAWHRHGLRNPQIIVELCCEQAALERRQEQLAERLGSLAQQLKALDNWLAHGDSRREDLLAARVGTCPYCGYPSLGSGLCAFCGPQLTR